MATGALTPDAALRVFSDLGLVLPGSKLNTYVSGSPSTPLTTYSDSALTVPNTNPIVASSGGLFGPIYLTPGVAYKYVLTDAAAVTVWTRDPVMVPTAGYGDGSTVKAADGTVAAPGVTFLSDPDTGLYHEGTNALALATNGIKAFGIDSTQFIDSPTQPRVHATTVGTQSLVNVTITTLAFDAEVFDVGGLHDPVTLNSRITVPAGADGTYLVSVQVSFAPNATGERIVYLLKNGAILAQAVAAPSSGGAGSNTTIPLVTLVVLAAADYLELQAYQSSGGALTTSSATAYAANRFSVVKLW